MGSVTLASEGLVSPSMILGRKRFRDLLAMFTLIISAITKDADLANHGMTKYNSGAECNSAISLLPLEADTTKLSRTISRNTGTRARP